MRKGAKTEPGGRGSLSTGERKRRPCAMVLDSPIAKEELGLSLRLRGGGAPDSKGKGARMQPRRTPC